jgi:hypothetical protein
VDINGGWRQNKDYIIIAITVSIVIFFAIIIISNNVFQAYIPDKFLDEDWIEDASERSYDEDFFGLEKQASFTYKIDKESSKLYPAYITVTTIKTLFMMSEEDLYDKTVDTLNEIAYRDNLIYNDSAVLTGSRVIFDNRHKTKYIIYEGIDNSTNINKEIRIIGECWNCGVSGTSVICIGYAQVTEYSNNLEFYFGNWAKIIADKEGTFGNDFYKNLNGLIYNVKCH